MSEIGTLRHRFLLIGRGLYMGILWGVVFGVGVLAALVVPGFLAGIDLGSPDIGGLVQAGLQWALLLFPISAAIGGGVGGGIALTAGLALALSGPNEIHQLHRARLVTGSTAAAVPLAVAYHYLDRPGSTQGYVIAAGVAAVAAVSAVLLTPRIVNGPPPPRNASAPMPPEQRSERAPDGAHEPTGTRSGSEPRGTGMQEPQWLIVGRAVSWGVIGGAALGALCGAILRLGTDGFAALAVVWLALGGAVLGAVLGFTGGLARALNAGEDERSGARLG